MNISKYEYCYNTDMLYNYGLKEIKPIVMTIPHHLSYVWPEGSRATPKSLINSLLVKPKDALNSTFSAITTLHISGSLSSYHQEFLAIYRLWYILCWNNSSK